MNVASMGQHTQCSPFLFNISMMANILIMEHQGLYMFMTLFTFKGYEPFWRSSCGKHRQTRVYRLFCIGFPGPNLLLQNRCVSRFACIHMGLWHRNNLPQSAYTFPFLQSLLHLSLAKNTGAPKSAKFPWCRRKWRSLWSESPPLPCDSWRKCAMPPLQAFNRKSFPPGRLGGTNGAA